MIIIKENISNVVLFFNDPTISLPNLVVEAIQQAVCQEVLSIHQANMLLSMNLEELKTFIRTLESLHIIKEKSCLAIFFDILCAFIFLSEM